MQMKRFAMVAGAVLLCVVVMGASHLVLDFDNGSSLTLTADPDNNVRSIVRSGHADAGYVDEGYIKFAIGQDPIMEVNGGENNELVIRSPDGYLHLVQETTEYVTIGRRDSGAGIKLNIPTSDPHDAGCLWNDNGTLKISAGQ